MSDKLERDVEEVLENIEDFDWNRRRQRRPGPIRRAIAGSAAAITRRAAAFSGAHLMLIGAILLVAGILLRLQALGAWLAITGVLVFFIGLVLQSRGRRAKNAPAEPSAKGGYWRDRYIQYDGPDRPNPADWLRRLRRPRRKP